MARPAGMSRECFGFLTGPGNATNKGWREKPRLPPRWWCAPSPACGGGLGRGCLRNGTLPMWREPSPGATRRPLPQAGEAQTELAVRSTSTIGTGCQLDLVALRRDPEPPDDFSSHCAGLKPRADAGAAKSVSGLQSDHDDAVLVLGPAAAFDRDRLHVAPFDMIRARRAVAPQAFDVNIPLPDDPEGPGHEVGISVNRERGDRTKRQQHDVDQAGRQAAPEPVGVGRGALCDDDQCRNPDVPGGKRLNGLA